MKIIVLILLLIMTFLFGVRTAINWIAYKLYRQNKITALDRKEMESEEYLKELLNDQIARI